MNMEKPRTRDRAAVFLKAALQALVDAGGDLPFRTVLSEVEGRVDLIPYDLEIYNTTGNSRWRSVLHFYSIDCVKAGFIKKSKGRWFITPEGREVAKLSGEEILDRAVKAYRAWKAVNPKTPTDAILPKPVEEDAATEKSFVYENAESEALQEIRDAINQLGPYEFQDLVAALLRGMGYYTPVIAPKGKDGGTDILAYPDPLGTKTPHIRVQVKHRQDKTRREEVAALRGITRQDREIGLFVSSGGFSPDASREAGSGAVHIELIDLDQLIDLWIEHYEKLEEGDKARLRLRTVYFLAPE